MFKVPIAGVLVAGTLLAVFAGRPLHAQGESVTYYDLAAMPSAPYGPMDAKAVVTPTSSFAYAVLPAGWHQTVHHHDQEQITMGLGGTVALLVGGVSRPLGIWGAALPPSNVEHGMVNDNDASGVMVEFQAFHRSDWLPPHTAIPQPKSAEPAVVPRNTPVNADFALPSAGWELLTNGARAKSITGKTIRLTVWDLSARNAAASLPERAAGERFAFVLKGRASIMAGSSVREAGPEMLAVIAPAARNVQLRSTGTPETAVAVFETLAH
jgi:hypothetical protein